MGGVIRFISAAAAAAMALAPFTAAAASPSPSPSLDSIIAKPPSGYTQLTSSPFHGEFTASQYAGQAADSTKRSQVEATLTREGFVDGYGDTWVNRSSGHVLIEAVLAFTGGRGARRWLTAAEAGDKSDPTYSHSNSMSGIDPYYGEHVVDKTNNTTGDAFSFVKGNDVFLVLAASGADDNLTLATSQTTAQYQSAPDSTIPSSQWPENQSSNSAAFDAGRLTGDVLFGVLILGVIGVVVGLILRSRRRAVAPAFFAAGMATPAVQMSPDGNYWYDGQGWRDAAQEVPPTAQRSSDGTLWWDGRTWRPVPQPVQPPQAPSS
jgi:hypothetical protein